jgi:uncharacterized protein YutE (UPF0331/DUF86 family)
VVDKPLYARKVAVIRDAVERVRAMLPPSAEAFAADRTAREVVVLNLFVAIQASIDLAARWLADEGWDVPQRYGELFTALADHRVLSTELARRLAEAVGFRNLVAHQYGAIDWARLHAMATSSDLEDLEQFCAELATKLA